jgi:hypothetical protein
MGVIRAGFIEFIIEVMSNNRAKSDTFEARKQRGGWGELHVSHLEDREEDAYFVEQAFTDNNIPIRFGARKAEFLSTLEQGGFHGVSSRTMACLRDFYFSLNSGSTK